MLRLPETDVIAAREELDRAMLDKGRWKLEMAYSFSAGQHGHLRRMPGPERFPACFALMGEVERAFGLSDAQCDVGRVQVMVRRYIASKDLRLHVDSELMFEEPVLSVILRCDGQGDGLVLRLKHHKPADGSVFQVEERPGVAICLEGPSRYEFGHEVPPCTGPRLSLTWRWFHPEYLRELEDADEVEDRETIEDPKHL